MTPLAAWGPTFVGAVVAIFTYGRLTQRVDQGEKRMDKHDSRFDRVDEKLEEHGEKISSLTEWKNGVQIGARIGSKET